MIRHDTGFGRPYDDGLRYRRQGRFYDFRRDPGGLYRDPYDAVYGDRPRSRHRYAEGYGGTRRDHGFHRGYDDEYAFPPGRFEAYKSAWQTNYGDPFGDRQRRTPMRVMPRRGWDEHRHRPFASYDREYPRWSFRDQY